MGRILEITIGRKKDKKEQRDHWFSFGQNMKTVSHQTQARMRKAVALLNITQTCKGPIPGGLEQMSQD